MPFLKVFLIIYLPDYPLFIENYENMRNENEKSFAERAHLFYVTIYGRQHIYVFVNI